MSLTTLPAAPKKVTVLDLVLRQPLWQVLTRVLTTLLPDRLRLSCRAGEGDDPSPGAVLFGGQLEHRMLLGRWWGGLGCPEAVWMLSGGSVLLSRAAVLLASWVQEEDSLLTWAFFPSSLPLPLPTGCL